MYVVFSPSSSVKTQGVPRLCIICTCRYFLVVCRRETVELATDCYIVASIHPTHSAHPPGNDAPEQRLLGSAA